MPVNRYWNPPQEHGCGDCRYWVDPGNFSIGPCRKHAPIARTERLYDDHARREQWPQTTQEDWCGDWQMRDGDPTALVHEARETEEG